LEMLNPQMKGWGMFELARRQFEAAQQATTYSNRASTWLGGVVRGAEEIALNRGRFCAEAARTMFYALLREARDQGFESYLLQRRERRTCSDGGLREFESTSLQRRVSETRSCRPRT
jgi:hypothetical protein